MPAIVYKDGRDHVLRRAEQSLRAGGASIPVTIRDASGLVVPGATVKVINQGNNNTTKTKTGRGARVFGFSLRRGFYSEEGYTR